MSKKHLTFEEIMTGIIKQDKRKIKTIKRITQDTDFPGTNTFKESHLVGLLVQLS